MSIVGKSGKNRKIIATGVILPLISILLSFCIYTHQPDAAEGNPGAVLEVKQTADSSWCQPGEFAEYRITVKQISGYTAAKDVKLCNIFDQKGIVLEPLLVEVTLDGRDISRQCSFFTKGNSLLIDTNQDLKKGEILTAAVPAELKSVPPGVEQLNVQAKAAADNAAAVCDSGRTKIIRPKLEVENAAGRKSGSMGNRQEYCYSIRQKQKRAAAETIQIKNRFHQPGVRYIGNSVEVSVGEKVITDDCKIDIVDNGYLTIESYRPLLYGDTMTVRYQTEYAAGNLREEKIKNTFAVFADGRQQDSRVSMAIIREQQTDVKRDRLGRISGKMSR